MNSQTSTPKILITGGKGYIGSRLRTVLNADSIDTEQFGNPDSLISIKTSYQDITKSQIDPYDIIIHLAGHSSVAMCVNDPDGAIGNNICGFASFLRLCEGKRFIYASSSSVYNSSGDMMTEEFSGFRPVNRYDVSKHVIDLIAQTSKIEYYGLRFGTVCGWSPNLRTDLMINKMVYDAKKTGVITISNPRIHRPILALKDLVRAIITIVDGPTAPGIYNLASFNSTVEDIAYRVASLCESEVVLTEGTPTYDFTMSCDKFCDTYGFHFTGSVEGIVHELITRVSNNMGVRT